MGWWEARLLGEGQARTGFYGPMLCAVALTHNIIKGVFGGFVAARPSSLLVLLSCFLFKKEGGIQMPQMHPNEPFQAFPAVSKGTPGGEGGVCKSTPSTSGVCLASIDVVHWLGGSSRTCSFGRSSGL
jgi:hypothetical protein